MEAIFDRKGTYLDTNIYSLRNSALLYNISTTKGMFGSRKFTTIRSVTDVDPVGVINWKERSFEVYGRAVPVDALKTKSGGLFSSSRQWRWSRYSYKVKYQGYVWTAGINGTSEAMFHPYRHHLFSKNEPARMQISRNALEDEIFLLLVFLYSEVKRQDAQRNSSVTVNAGASCS